VPGSQAGAALFLKEDDRQLRRYIFRFEFRNDTVLQPPSRPHQLSLSGKIAKYSQKSSTMKQVEIKTKAALLKEEDATEMAKSEETKSQEAHMAYLGAISDITSDATVSADAFIGLVNSPSEQDTEGATWKRRPNRSWGPGYEDAQSVGGDQDAGSDYSSDFGTVDDEDEEDDDEDDDADDGVEGGRGSMRNKETVEQSFRRLRT